MSSNFERLHKIRNEAYAENFSILSQKSANPLLYLALLFLIGIPFWLSVSITITYLAFSSFYRTLGQTLQLRCVPSILSPVNQGTIVTKQFTSWVGFVERSPFTVGGVSTALQAFNWVSSINYPNSCFLTYFSWFLTDEC